MTINEKKIIKAYKYFIYCLIPIAFIACENSQQTDNDRDLIDEEKVQEKYDQLKENLKETGEELDSAGEEIGEEMEDLGDKIDEEI